MSDGELVDVLQEHGYEPVETELPGGWSTDGEWTVCVKTDHMAGGRMNDYVHTAIVYNAPAEDVDVATERLAWEQDTSSELAIRRALDHARQEAE